MNLHELRSPGAPRNIAITDLDWTIGGFAIVIDENWRCLDIEMGRENFTCYPTNTVRGHGQDCLRRGEGVREHERDNGIGEGIYLCECRCHNDENVGVYATYIRLGRTRDEATMYGTVNEPNEFLGQGEDGYRQYWCHPCRRNTHHWTE